MRAIGTEAGAGATHFGVSVAPTTSRLRCINPVNRPATCHRRRPNARRRCRGLRNHPHGAAEISDDFSALLTHVAALTAHACASRPGEVHLRTIARAGSTYGLHRVQWRPFDDRTLRDVAYLRRYPEVLFASRRCLRHRPEASTRSATRHLRIERHLDNRRGRRHPSHVGADRKAGRLKRFAGGVTLTGVLFSRRPRSRATCCCLLCDAILRRWTARCDTGGVPVVTTTVTPPSTAADGHDRSTLNYLGGRKRRPRRPCQSPRSACVRRFAIR